MNEIVTRKDEFPVNVDDLAKFVLIGRDRLAAVRAAIRAIDKVGIAAEVYQQKLAEGQEIAEAVLDAEVRLGELRAAVPKEKGGRPEKTSDNDVVSFSSLQKFDSSTGLTTRDNQRLEQLAAHPEAVEAEKAKARDEGRIVTRQDVLKAITDEKRTKKEERREEKRERKRYELKKEIPEDTYRLIVGDIRDGIPDIENDSIDYIITDPPYPRDYLPMYGHLSALAARVLKPGGSLLVMSGQSYLPDVIALLDSHMQYHWCLAYMTPGGQSPSLWQKRTNTFWKPVLWYVKGKYSGDYIGDVLKSAVNDNDKRFHEWGQSLSGMRDIVERFTNPGDMILDPFLGGGTTGVAAVTMGRKFVGMDIKKENVDTSEQRIKEAYSICQR